MRFTILVKATDSEAGVLVDASGLQASSKGWRIKYSRNGGRSFVDGPFAETKELVARYTVIDAKSREEAIPWLRQYLELEDFGDSPAIEQFRELSRK